jgi:Uma2 family endonuclease
VPTHVRSLKPKGQYWTDQRLALGGNSDIKYELWDGRIMTMPPAKPGHGMVTSRLMAALGHHIYESKLDELFDGQPGFRLSLEHCFEPDISFVSNERLKVALPQGLARIFVGI